LSFTILFRETFTGCLSVRQSRYIRVTEVLQQFFSGCRYAINRSLSLETVHRNAPIYTKNQKLSDVGTALLRDLDPPQWKRKPPAKPRPLHSILSLCPKAEDAGTDGHCRKPTTIQQQTSTEAKISKSFENVSLSCGHTTIIARTSELRTWC